MLGKDVEVVVKDNIGINSNPRYLGFLIRLVSLSILMFKLLP